MRSLSVGSAVLSLAKRARPAATLAPVTRGRLAALLAISLAATGLAAARGAPRSREGAAPPFGRVALDAAPAPALGGTLPFAVYLPPSYTAKTTRRYPVVYFLHGLPAAPYAFRGIGFLGIALEQIEREAIVVAPRGARDGDTDPEYLDWGRGRNWETAIASELPAYVDAHYRTIATRRGRALVGVSAGGYGAVLLALHHLRSFSVVESWSGYFHPTDPTGTESLDLGSPEGNMRASAQALVPRLRSAFSRLPTFLGFYVGSEDARFRAENIRLARALSRAKVPFVFHIYPGAHEQSFWNAHAPDWLALALDHLQTGTSAGGEPGRRGTAPRSVEGRAMLSSVASRVAGARLGVGIYLPSRYGTGRARYPVVYYLHGLPAAPWAYRGFGFLGRSLERLARAAIIVAPQGAFPGDADPEWLQSGPGRRIAAFVAAELPRFIDRHFRTIRNRRGRALVGLSAGGFGALAIGLRHPETFSAIESWSGYLRPRDPSSRHVLHRAGGAVDAEVLRRFANRKLRPPVFLAFYVGREDWRFRPENELLDRSLRRLRVPHLFRVYQGAHSQRLWHRHLDAWLAMSLDHLAPPQ